MLGGSREVNCDFPACREYFDTTDGARVAAVRSGDVVAFCAEHSAHLIVRGVNLRTLQEVRRELGIGVPPALEDLRTNAEEEFIKSLK